MYKGVLFFDCDGTLVDEQEGIFSPTDKTLRTLEKLRANGYMTFLATGRPKRLTAGISNYFTGIITSNGTYVEFEGKCIQNIFFDPALMSELMEYMDAHNIFYTLEGQKCSYITKEPNSAFEEVVKVFHLPKSMYMPLKKIPAAKINKMSIYYSELSDINRLEDAFKGKIQIHRYRSCRAADLDMAGMTKGVGIKAVTEHFNIKRENTYAFGDGGNDAAMFEAVGHGVAMEGYAPELEGIADFYTKSVKDEGIAYAVCEHYKLV